MMRTKMVLEALVYSPFYYLMQIIVVMSHFDHYAIENKYKITNFL